MSTSPTDIGNRALDAIGINHEMGDIEGGGRIENVCLRAYSEARNQLLRTAPWQFARRDVPLLLLADASGNTPNVGTEVPSGFMYEYRQPIDMARIRFIPANPIQASAIPQGNIVTPDSGVSLTTGIQPIVGYRQVPSRFLITNDPNYGSVGGSTDYVDGQSPQGGVVILSDVPNARCVYTFNALYPSVWDALFTEAMVAYLAQQIALALWVDKDRRFGMEVRNQQIAIAKQKILAARTADGNATWSSSDIRVDWMQYRRVGGTWTGIGPYGGSGAPGDWGCWGAGWNGSCGFADGSAY